MKEDGAEIPYQVETIDGKDYIWVCSSFAAGASHTYGVAPGKPKATQPRVILKKDQDEYLLDNGLFAVKVPAGNSGQVIPGPIAAVKMADKWVGASSWHTSLKLKKLTATVIGDGTILAKVRLRYEFDGMAGADKSIPAFAEIDVALAPGWPHAEIFERHDMNRDDWWELEASKGWSPKTGRSQPYSGGFAGKPPPTERPLLPGALPYAREDLFINLFPRWNQHCKDGWFFTASDGSSGVGAVVVRASQWIWPHDNSIQAIVKPAGDYAGLRGSTWHGQRLWWLIAGSGLKPDVAEVTRYAWEHLDKLNQDFIIEWPDVTKGSFSGMNFYNGGEVNPTDSIRGAGGGAIRNAANIGDLGTLTRAQAMLHGDAYGSYWNFWSPENPNFFTDFNRVPIALTASLRTHPQFEQLRKMAEMKLREDLYHSVTMPGGAGQECPGYMAHALKGWGELAPVCREYLKFDPTASDRYKAAQGFLRRISQPDGNVRRFLPMGDTHPGKDGANPIDVPADEVAKFTTEELPGFGVIFNNNPGKPAETYLAFKAGPNRGHYHGDQLSFHYCANAHNLAVDHHCSYHPRAGQEHMHNRVAFWTDQMPFANMDGYERLIAFKTSPATDIAVAQVESDRLRQVEKVPPEMWHQEYPQIPLAKPLVYRRTMVFMKDPGGGQDYFVIRDQFWSPIAINATFCLHVLSDEVQQNGEMIDFGNLTLYCATPVKFDYSTFPWSHDNGGTESTQGARLTLKGDKGEFVTVIYPGKAPAIAAIPGGVKVGGDEITFAGDQPTAGDASANVTVKRGGNASASLGGADINLDRFQGEVGLFVPDAGYPFGTIPDWLIRQRAKKPDWAK